MIVNMVAPWGTKYNYMSGMGIPVKVNIDSGGEAERRSGVKVNSSRSEATLRDDCAVSVRHRQARLSGAKRRSGSSGDLGCRGKGQQPLCPCFLHGEEVTCIACDVPSPDWMNSHALQRFSSPAV